MKTIGIISWKGGTGKTTLACNLEERATTQGLNAVLLDLDPQQNAIRHLNFRSRNSPSAPALQILKAGMDSDNIKAIRKMTDTGNQDLLICDLPGTDAFTMDRAVSFLDLLLIPLAPAPYDVSDTIELIAHCQKRGWPYHVLPTNLPMGNRRIDQLITVAHKLGAPVAPVRLRRRVTYLDASTMGLGVCEYAPDSPAAREMNDCWLWVAEEIGLAANDTDQYLQEAYRDQSAA